MNYEVHTDSTIPGARVFKFATKEEALTEAAKLVIGHTCRARVLKLVGTYEPTVEWIPALENR